MLFQCFNALKVYGKEPEQMTDTVALFQRVLGPYPFPAIQRAFDAYLSRNTSMPAPADIVNIIDPPKPELSAALYVSLQEKSRDGTYLTPEERGFCEAFRQQELRKANTQPTPASRSKDIRLMTQHEMVAGGFGLPDEPVA
jgi:hypothetical protein